MTSRSLAQALGLVLTGMFTVVGAAQAADTPSTQKAPHAIAAQGVQVAIDPSTGKLREPTAAERVAYSKAAKARQSGVSAFSTQPATRADAMKTAKKVTASNGVKATRVSLPQSMMSSVVATRAPDGSISIHHEDQGTQAAPKAPEATR